MRTLVATLALVAACGPPPRGRDDTVTPSDARAGDDGGNNTCVGGSCSAACEAANENHSSVGCEYYAVDMDGASGAPYDGCFAVFVANTSMTHVHITVDRSNDTVDVSKFAKLPVGAGQALTYAPYDPAAGLEPGQVAILFLDYDVAVSMGTVACPVPAALGSGVQVHGTGLGSAFHITTDVPVVAYQMLPYGGGAAAATGASLLIPTSAWQSSYIAVSASDAAPPVTAGQPSHDIVAMQDGTHVTIRPRSPITSGPGVVAGAVNEPYMVTLARGEYLQLTQSEPLSGSPITSDAPIGVFGGHQIMEIDGCCGDHGEQMLTPVSALGMEYVAAPHGDRKVPDGVPAHSVDPRIFRIYGAVDGTQLSYDPADTGPATVNLGEMLEIRTTGAFVVRSQDAMHPFAMFAYMRGGGGGGWGDPDFVRLVPPSQYLGHYVFFTDPSYPFTTLTVVRQQVMGTFADVTLDCRGVIPAADWQAVGKGTYEIAFEKLVDHWDKQYGCDNGVHVMDSSQPFGVWVWGWGSVDTDTGWVSYGYPAGEAVMSINDVILE